MATKTDRKLMDQVAAEMNAVMGLDPAISCTAEVADDKLRASIIFEATAGGVEKNAIRADDFVTADPDKATFTKEAHDFFVAAGIWDPRQQRVVMPAKAKEAVKESADQAALDAGESTGADPQPAAAEQAPPSPAAKTKKKGNAAPAAPAGQAPEAKKENAMRTQKAVKGAAKKAAKKGRGTAAQRNSAAKARKEPANKDQYGFREGSTTSKAIAFLAAGKHTMAQAKEKFGDTFYGALKKMTAAGHRVKTNDDSTFTITAKK